MIEILYSESVTCMFDIVVGLGDVSAFTLSVATLVAVDNQLIQVTLNPKPYTLHSHPHIPHSKPHTLHRATSIPTLHGYLAHKKHPPPRTLLWWS